MLVKAARTSMSPAIMAVLVLVAPACGKLVGIEDYSVGGPPAEIAPYTGQCGGFVYATASCGACVDRACCAAADECASHAACRGLFDCELACSASDAACRAACAASHYGTVLYSDARLDLAQCLVASCGAQCGHRSVGLFPPSCAACVEQRCDEEAVAVAADRDALGFAACAAQGTFPHDVDAAATYGFACSAEGEEPPDSGVAIDYLSCTRECAIECAEPDWSCLGNVVWPDSGSLNVDLRVAVRDESFKPVADLSMIACAAPDPSCIGSLARETTDSHGIARLSFGVVSGLPYYLRSEANALFDEMLAYSVPPPASSLVVSQFLVIGRALMSGFGPPLDHAHLHVIVQSCGARPAPGVRISVPGVEGVTTLYTNTTFVPTGEDRTNATGLAVVLGVPTAKGVVQVEARLADTNDLVASANVPVKEGRMTFVTLRPGPQPR